MKKVFLYILLAASVLSSCKKDDSTVFDKSTDERLNETLAAYQSQLIGAQNGWKAFVSPGSGATYFFYFKFNDQNRVKMYSTFDSASAVTSLESSYRLKALQQPSIIFDTYSYLHVLSDPNEATQNIQANINGGPLGVGLSSDFEFYIDSALTDTIKLIGRFHGTKAMLIRATQEEAAAYDNKDLGKGFVFRNIARYLNYFKRATIGGVAYEINVNQFNRSIRFTWVDNTGNANTFVTDYYYSATGISFIDPLVNGAQTISGFDDITWDAGNTTLAFSVNGQRTIVTGVSQPVNVDKTAPQRWWQSSIDEDIFWISEDGFHINGVDDALNNNSLPGFAALVFKAQYGTSGGVTYDLLIPFFNKPFEYGYAFRPPVFRSDGRVVFPVYGTLGTVPAADEAVGESNRAQMAESTGYYFVQTGENSYDMVSAKDSKIWITWRN